MPAKSSPSIFGGRKESGGELKKHLVHLCPQRLQTYSSQLATSAVTALLARNKLAKKLEDNWQEPSTVASQSSKAESVDNTEIDRKTLLL